MSFQQPVIPIKWLTLLCVSFLLLYSCKNEKVELDKDFHFTLLSPDETGINFNNLLIESDSVNFLVNQYIYIGSGVAVADFNNDGLQDVFFAGEQVSCKLYVNKGAFKFKDVTKEAGLETTKWCTGVSITDINSDGLPDIYVCVSHVKREQDRKNMLFVNKGNLHFREEAADYGLADASYSTQAAFFDYDKDSDLDMYLMNHNVFKNNPNNIITTNAEGTSVATDKLFRNEGVPAGNSHPVFKEVSAQAGIHDKGYGLGLAISDLNYDGWPDVYVANDFLSNDLLWLNNKNGTFTNCIVRSLHHQSYNSMGVDIADMNNDALPDISVLDMQPETNYRKKTMFTGTNPVRYDMEQKISGYQPQFTRNMLQLNNGTIVHDSIPEPFFSEIAQLTGMSETDWSWSVLMADFDNDGFKDIQITNGIAKDLTNNDFLFFRNSNTQRDGGASTDTDTSIASLRRDLDSYGSIKINNYFYHNNGNLTFRNTTAQTGMAVPSVSNGAVYADLDNDGDLDMIMNNMNQECFVWRNELRQSSKDSTHNYLTVALNGPMQNQYGIGTKLTLYAGDTMQFVEQNMTRGYLSAVDSRLHFGIGNKGYIDSLRIVWPDGKMQLLQRAKANQLLNIYYRDAHDHVEDQTGNNLVLFEDITSAFIPSFKHEESSFFDWGEQRLLPQKYSQLGPPLSKGDVNGDGLEDLFVGGGAYQSGKIYIQQRNGDFAATDLVTGGKAGEDISAVFFDADGDKDQDLLIAEGSSEFGNSATLNIPCLYINNGKGNFTYDKTAFEPNIATISQSIALADYDSDGDIDVFLAGRILPGRYPSSPRSYLLQNNGGKFTDVTAKVCPELVNPGLLTAAVWTDFNKDRTVDLVICGEWMSIRFFRNVNGKLEEITNSTGLTGINGLWRSLYATDMDEDGDTDFVAGNMGLNDKYHSTPQHPYMLYVKDIDDNGSPDLIPAYYIKDEKGRYDMYPAIDRTEFSDEVPAIKKQFLLNEDFAKVSMNELMSNIGKEEMLGFKCETTASCWIENMSNGKFKTHQLPVQAQFAPLNAALAKDIDGDGSKDLLIAGNEYQAEVGSGRYDASYGLFLRGNGKGMFQPVAPMQSGFIINGDVKSLQCIKTKKGTFIFAGVNNHLLRCFRVNTGKIIH